LPDNSGLIVLGFDPGISITGYGLIQVEDGVTRCLDYGAWKLPARAPLSERLRRLYDYIDTLIKATCERPMPESAIEVAIEDFYIGRVRAAVTIGQARAMALLAAAQAGLPVYMYKPLEVKQFVTTYGRGDKFQVQQMVKALLNLDEAPEPADASDALAVALCHCLRRDSAALLKEQRSQ